MIDDGERAAMEASVRGALTHALARRGADADLDDVLGTLGWLDLLRHQPDDALAIVFGALGATNATATALDDVLARALGHEPCRDVAVVLPAFAAWDAPGRLEGQNFHATGLATARMAHARELLVACGTSSEAWTVVVPAMAADARRVRGVDPDCRLHAVRLQGSAKNLTPLDPDAWSSAVALGQRALAHQSAAACRAMLDLARTHALERVQFGRPIARFQAVRHRLADALVAIEALEATLVAARDAPGPMTAALAKAAAGRAARTVGGHCQQVLAGVGFTTEHRFHRFLKRTLALEGLFGSADRIVLDVGRRLLAARHVPALIDL
jgi:hypothetical protein